MPRRWVKSHCASFFHPIIERPIDHLRKIRCQRQLGSVSLFGSTPRKKSSIAVTPTMYPKLEKVSVLHSTFPFSECSNCALLPEAIALGMYCARSEFDVRRPDMYTCLHSLPTYSGSNSITVRRAHPFCNHAAFGFGVIDCAEPEGRTSRPRNVPHRVGCEQ